MIPCHHESARMRRRKTICPLLFAVGVLLSAQVFAQSTERPTPPTRDPHTPGYVTAKELPDGAIPPANADGNFIIGPDTHPGSGNVRVRRRAQGNSRRVHDELVRQQDLSWHCARANTFGTPDPSDPAKLVVTTSHPAPYTRKVAVYVPEAIRRGQRCAVHRRDRRA